MAEPINTNANAAAKTELDSQPVNGNHESAGDLTAEEKRLIRDDWELVRQDLQTAGTKLFLVFFIQNPTYAKMFRWAKDLDVPSWTYDTPINTLPKRMHQHSLIAATQISIIVDNLEEPEELEDLFTQLGRRHVGRNVGPTHWQNFNNSLLYLLRTALTPAGYDDKHEEAWRKALQVISDGTLKAIKLAEENGQIPPQPRAAA